MQPEQTAPYASGSAMEVLTGRDRRDGADGVDLLTDDHHAYIAAVETTQTPMVVTNPRQPGNPVVFVNDAFLAMTGYTAAEIVGAPYCTLQGSDTDPDTLRDLHQAIANGLPFASEIQSRRKDGATFWCALFIAPVFDRAGKLLFFFGSQLDVDQQRAGEDARQHARKLEAVGQLAGGIAHDFNNLLQVMIGHQEELEDALEQPVVDRQTLRQALTSARAAAERAATLTQLLLAFSRKQKLDVGSVDLNALVWSMNTLVGRTVGSQISVETDFAADLRHCRVDPSQAQLAILNILSNGRDAIGERADGRMTIVTRNLDLRHDDRVAYSGLGPGPYVAITITDNGIGMSPEILRRAMDPFFTTKEEGRGTGLGLSMVYGFVQQSGGAVRLESQEGVGTTIRLLFPATQEACTASIVVPEPAVIAGVKQTILVVEDREDIGKLAQLLLERAGYTVHRATNGVDALKILLETPAIELLFTDLVMPGMNGLALARQAQQMLPQLKILLTSGFSEALRERTDAEGLEFAVISKPYRRGDLLQKIRQVLSEGGDA